MENDSIRSSGTNTLVDIWIEGKMRGICVSHAAIGAYVGFDRASGMNDDDRREFVRTHLPLVLAAAKERLRENDPGANVVIIDTGHLERADGASTDRRKTDRRKVDRRKVKVPRGNQPERRRGDRRQGERRTKPPSPESL